MFWAQTDVCRPLAIQATLIPWAVSALARSLLLSRQEERAAPWEAPEGRLLLLAALKPTSILKQGSRTQSVCGGPLSR